MKESVQGITDSAMKLWNDSDIQGVALGSNVSEADSVVDKGIEATKSVLQGAVVDNVQSAVVYFDDFAEKYGYDLVEDASRETLLGWNLLDKPSEQSSFARDFSRDVPVYVGIGLLAAGLAAVTGVGATIAAIAAASPRVAKLAHLGWIGVKNLTESMVVSRLHSNNTNVAKTGGLGILTDKKYAGLTHEQIHALPEKERIKVLAGVEREESVFGVVLETIGLAAFGKLGKFGGAAADELVKSSAVRRQAQSKLNLPDTPNTPKSSKGLAKELDDLAETANKLTINEKIRKGEVVPQVYKVNGKNITLLIDTPVVKAVEGGRKSLTLPPIPTTTKTGKKIPLTRSASLREEARQLNNVVQGADLGTEEGAKKAIEGVRAIGQRLQAVFSATQKYPTEQIQDVTKTFHESLNKIRQQKIAYREAGKPIPQSLKDFNGELATIYNQYGSHLGKEFKSRQDLDAVTDLLRKAGIDMDDVANMSADQFVVYKEVVKAFEKGGLPQIAVSNDALVHTVMRGSSKVIVDNLLAYSAIFKAGTSNLLGAVSETGASFALHGVNQTFKSLGSGARAAFRQILRDPPLGAQSRKRLRGVAQFDQRINVQSHTPTNWFEKNIWNPTLSTGLEALTQIDNASEAFMHRFNTMNAARYVMDETIRSNPAKYAKLNKKQALQQVAQELNEDLAKSGTNETKTRLAERFLRYRRELAEDIAYKRDLSNSILPTTEFAKTLNKGFKQLAPDADEGTAMAMSKWMLRNTVGLFQNTATNAVDKAMRTMSMGHINSVRRAGKFAQNRQMALSLVNTGAVAALGFSSLSNEGVIQINKGKLTDDPRKRRSLKELAAPDYTIRIGDKTLTLDHFGEMGVVMSSMITLGRITEYMADPELDIEPTEVFSESLLGMGRLLTAPVFNQTIGKLTKTLSDISDGKGEGSLRALERLAGDFVKNLLPLSTRSRNLQESIKGHKVPVSGWTEGDDVPNPLESKETMEKLKTSVDNMWKTIQQTYGVGTGKVYNVLGMPISTHSPMIEQIANVSEGMSFDSDVAQYLVGSTANITGDKEFRKALEESSILDQDDLLRDLSKDLKADLTYDFKPPSRFMNVDLRDPVNNTLHKMSVRLPYKVYQRQLSLHGLRKDDWKEMSDEIRIGGLTQARIMKQHERLRRGLRSYGMKETDKNSLGMFRRIVTATEKNYHRIPVLRNFYNSYKDGYGDRIPEDRLLKLAKRATFVQAHTHIGNGIAPIIKDTYEMYSIANRQFDQLKQIGRDSQ